MTMYNLIENSETSGCLQQYCRDESALNHVGNIIDFPADNNNSISFKFKEKITGKTGIDGAKDVEIIVPLKYLNNFWRTLEMLLINCEINLTQTWSANLFISAGTNANQVPTFAITNTKLYVQVVTLSTENNAKLLQ